MSALDPAFASKRESRSSLLSGCRHAETQSVQAPGDRDFLVARTLPKSHMSLRAPCGGTHAAAGLILPVLQDMRAEGNICVAGVTYEHAEKRPSHVAPQ